MAYPQIKVILRVYIYGVVNLCVLRWRALWGECGGDALLASRRRAGMRVRAFRGKGPVLLLIGVGILR